MSAKLKAVKWQQSSLYQLERVDYLLTDCLSLKTVSFEGCLLPLLILWKFTSVITGHPSIMRVFMVNFGWNIKVCINVWVIYHINTLEHSMLKFFITLESLNKIWVNFDILALQRYNETLVSYYNTIVQIIIIKICSNLV